ncbi:hypothetical protein BSNK01_07730 [Bacillaceae bacterium]
MVIGILLAVVCAVAYSANYICLQLGMKKTSKDNGNFASLLSAVLTVFLIYLLMGAFGEKKAVPFNFEGMFYYFMAGFFTAFLGRVLLNGGIRRIGSPRAAAVKNAAPIVTVALAVTILGERISLWGGIGIAIIFLALFFQAKADFSRERLKVEKIKDEKQEDKAGDEIEDKTKDKTKAEKKKEKEKRLGFVLAAVAAVSFGIGQTARKMGIIHYADPILGSLVGSAFALLVFVCMEIVQKRFKDTVWNNFLQPNAYFILAGVLTGIAQVSFFVSLLYTNVSYTSVVAAMEPVITVILGKIFLQREEKVTLRITFTACAVFLGTLILVFGRS